MELRRTQLTTGTQLSALELAVLKGIAKGLQSKEIAVAICRSAGTVELYVRMLFAKFDARSRAHLVSLAIKSKVINPDDV
ncbi:MAG: helix-turn-helix transcriptional regulator [Candidatus Eremiobacteraeota bacterium]|nr:helix-turn-helix transcriptional regulator [Candidatus Eremiobacteraeota bacterium]